MDVEHIRFVEVKLPFSSNIWFGFWRRRSEDDVIKNIMKVARKVKEIDPDPDPTLVEAANTEGAAETDFTFHDAVEAFRRIPGGGDNSGVLEFQSILEKLQIDDLQKVEKHLEILEERLEIAKILEGLDEEYESDDEQYPVMLLLKDIKAAAPTGGGNFAIKLAGPAIGAILAKVATSVAFKDLDLKPFEKVSGAVGLISVMAGLVLQAKKPGLSRAMLKFGSLAIGLPMIWSMSRNLEGEIISWFFLAIATAIVGVTAFYA